MAHGGSDAASEAVAEASASARWRQAGRPLLEAARRELAAAGLSSVAKLEFSPSGAVQQRSCDFRLVEGRLQIRGGSPVDLGGAVDLGACRLARVGFGAAPACVELLHRAGQTHLAPVAAPWRCFHFEVLVQAGGPGGGMAVHTEPYYCAATTSRAARCAALALMDLEMAGREASGGRYILRHKAAATRELLTVAAADTIAILPRGAELLVHEISETPSGNPRGRTDFGWVSVVSKGGRTLIEPVEHATVTPWPRPGLLLCATARLHLEALVPPGPFRGHGMHRVVASLLRQVARGATRHGGGANGSSTGGGEEDWPALQRGWEALSPAEQGAAQTLGWSYNSWQRGTFMLPRWAALNDVERRAAAVLDVDAEGGWDALREEQLARCKKAVEVEAAAAAPLENESGGCWLHLDKASVRIGALLDFAGSSTPAPLFCRVWMNDVMIGETRAVSIVQPKNQDALALRQELSALKLSALWKRAIVAGIDEASIEDVMDSAASHPKHALIDLIVSSVPTPTSLSTEEALRDELSLLGLKALRQKAIDAGASSDDLEDALDQDDPHGATLVLTMRTLLALAPLTSTDGLHATLSIADSHELAEVSWDERLRLQGTRPFPTQNMLRVELHCQLAEPEPEPKPEPELELSEVSTVVSDRFAAESIDDASLISPPSREELQNKLALLAKRDARLASSLTSSPFKGVSSSLQPGPAGVEPEPEPEPAAESGPGPGPELAPARVPEPSDGITQGHRTGEDRSKLLGVLVLHSQGQSGFSDVAASYPLRHPRTNSQSGSTGVDGTVSLWVTAPEETDYLEQLAVRRQRAAVARQLGTPVKILTNDVRVTRESVSWAALVIHSPSPSGGDSSGSSVQIDAMVSKFGPTSADLQGVPLAVAEPFLVDTDRLLNADTLIDAVVLCGRGAVSFVEKARRLQACGAAAVVFVNTEDEPFCPMSSGSAPQGADDDVLIPAVCIQKTAGADAVERVKRAGDGGGSDETSLAGGRVTISLLLCEHCRKEQEEESTAAAVAGIESGSLPRMPSSSALSISPPVTAETPAAGLNASNTYSTRASAREVSLTLATPQKANVVVAGTAAKADIDDDNVHPDETQQQQQQQQQQSMQQLPGWEERHDRRIEAFAKLRPLMRLLVAKHAAPGTDASPLGQTITETDIRRLAAGLMPYCEQDRVVAACRVRDIDKTSAVPYPRRQTRPNGSGNSPSPPVTLLPIDAPTPAPSISARSISESRNRVAQYDHKSNVGSHHGRSTDISIDAVLAVFFSAPYLPSTRVEWKHLCERLRAWEQWVVRRCEVVKSTLLFGDSDLAGPHRCTVRAGEQVDELESAVNAQGNVVSRVRFFEGSKAQASATEGWVAAVKRNGAVHLVPTGG
jgi:hypothetical protein